MLAQEFITELDSRFVNREIQKGEEWKPVGKNKYPVQGATASVWGHYSDPNTVVKVVGGGEYDVDPVSRNVTLAFVHFCVDYGYKSKHFPIIHGINVDDDEVLQIRIEKLIECSNDRLLSALSRLANCVRYNNRKDLPRYKNELATALKTNARIAKNNTLGGILEAIQLLHKAAPIYAKAHGLKEIWLDLHPGNWLLRPDGVIVAADPWFSEATEEYSYGSDASYYSDSDRSEGSGQGGDGWGIPRASK